jgi:hypothetical protein
MNSRLFRTHTALLVAFGIAGVALIAPAEERPAAARSAAVTWCANHCDRVISVEFPSVGMCRKL